MAGFEQDRFFDKHDVFFLKFRRKKMFLLKMAGFPFRDFKTHKIKNYIYVDL